MTRPASFLLQGKGNDPPAEQRKEAGTKSPERKRHQKLLRTGEPWIKAEDCSHTRTQEVDLAQAPTPLLGELSHRDGPPRERGELGLSPPPDSG